MATAIQQLPRPLLPLRDAVVYPHMVIPLFIGRAQSIESIERAMLEERSIVLVTQKKPDIETLKESDLFQVGTLATVLQLLRLPDGTVKVLVEGNERVRLESISLSETRFECQVSKMAEISYDNQGMIASLVRTVQGQFEQYVKSHSKIPVEVLTSLVKIDDYDRFADTIAAHMLIKIDAKQELLERNDLQVRLNSLLMLLEEELDLIQVEKKVRGRVKKQMERNHREYYLNEQMKAIQKEMGEMDEADNELNDLEKKIKSAGMPKEAKEKTLSELDKLRMMSPMSAEASVVRNYIDWMIKVPWKKRSKICTNLTDAEVVLEEDHYGLDKVKDRILEYLAVQQRVKKIKGPILCLVGPPGVGKTSLGKSIARSTGREFVRMALGGVRDEAEIRGHRRTYIGSLPGKVVQKISKSKVKNPLFLLDEIDKMAADFRGDPSSALLEVLDPEQNNTFNDHYLEVDYDLSDVMFVATANSMNIPAPLLDRMEVIRIPGYTEDEKLNIARRYLVPRQIKDNGLQESEIVIGDKVIKDIIRHYTREAGVRNLDRELAKICRKVVKELLLKHSGKSSKKIKEKAVTIVTRGMERYLGVRKFRYDLADEKDQVGQVNGLAWTEVGGEMLSIEAVVVHGKGGFQTTGQLGKVMEESIQTATTVVRSRAQALGVDKLFYKDHDVHIHVPEGAIPKDGPSAGVGMCTALVSALTNIPVRADVAMTGEITLRGEVLPIGGLKEKLLAAHRAMIKRVIIPEENRKDLAEIPKNIKRDLEVFPVRWIDEVLELALSESPTPLPEEEYQALLKKHQDSLHKMPLQAQ